MKRTQRARLCSLMFLVLALGLPVGGSLPSASAEPVTPFWPTIISPWAGQVVRGESFNVFFTMPAGVTEVRILLDDGDSFRPVRTFDADASPALVSVVGPGPHSIRIVSTVAPGRPGLVGLGSGYLGFTVELPPPGPPGISINSGAQFTNSRDVTLRVTWPADYHDGMVIDNDGGFGTFQTRETSTSVPWTLAGSGEAGLPKTVYARFVRRDGTLSGFSYSEQTFMDDIVLDLRAPTVRSATYSLARHVTSTMRHKVRVRAFDRVSGVTQVQFARKKTNPQDLMAFDRKVFFFEKAPRFVRVVDLGGNYSAWKKIVRRR